MDFGVLSLFLAVQWVGLSSVVVAFLVLITCFLVHIVYAQKPPLNAHADVSSGASSLAMAWVFIYTRVYAFVAGQCDTYQNLHARIQKVFSEGIQL